MVKLTNANRLAQFMSNKANELPAKITETMIAGAIDQTNTEISALGRGRARLYILAFFNEYLDNTDQGINPLVKRVGERLDMPSKDKSHAKGAFIALTKRFNPQGQSKQVRMQEVCAAIREISRVEGFKSDGTPKEGHCPLTGAKLTDADRESFPAKTKRKASQPATSAAQAEKNAKADTVTAPVADEPLSSVELAIQAAGILATLQARGAEGDAEANALITSLMEGLAGGDIMAAIAA